MSMEPLLSSKRCLGLRVRGMVIALVVTTLNDRCANTLSVGNMDG